MSTSRENGKSVKMGLRVWLNSRSGHIHLASNDASIISTVSKDPESKRYHPNLYRKLRQVLVDAGKWPEER